MQGDFQLLVQAGRSRPIAGLPQMRQQEDDEGSQPVRHDAGLEGTGRRDRGRAG